jgi:hypothetical protein
MERHHDRMGEDSRKQYGIINLQGKSKLKTKTKEMMDRGF